MNFGGFWFTIYAAARLTETIQRADKEGTGSHSATTKYTLDKTGNVIKITTPEGYIIKREYDEADRLIAEIQKDKQNKIENKTQFTYDKAGNITKITGANGAEENYEYDLLNRQTKRTAKNGGITKTIYDKNGRITKKILPNEYQAKQDQANGYKYTYDSLGRITSIIAPDGKIVETNTYDESGRIIKKLDAAQSGVTYEYDLGSRIKNIKTIGGTKQEYQYDAEGLRYEIEENNKLVQFIFNENKEVVVEQTEENLKRLIRSFDLWASECTKEKTWYHYASDEQGSTVFIADEEEIKNRYEYDAWGNAVVCEETVENRYKYTGQQFDPVTQQYYLRARYYNPVIARFTQEDEYRGDGLNLYAYCDNNPVMYYDPSGYVACEKDAVEKSRADGESSKPRYGERQVTDETYQKLRKQTPSPEIRDMVNQNVELPMPDPAIPGKTITKNLEADHIVSMDKIAKMDGFGKLTAEQQLQVLNNPENFTGLSKTANTSKGSKSFEEWTTYKKENIPINPDFRESMIEKSTEMEGKLQNQIDNFLN